MTRTLIIAEAGVNHNGDVNRALALVDAAAAAGADMVKFQTFSATELTTATAGMADYQKRNTGVEQSQLAMLKTLELSHQDHFRLEQRCHQQGIAFLSTPFDPASLRFLIDEMRLPRLKIGSGDLTNAPLLLEAARAGVEVILSTGMADAGEIAQALDVLAYGYHHPTRLPPSSNSVAGCFRRLGVADKVVLLHCTTEYPSAPETIHLRAMRTLAERFGLPVGFSDHSQGIAIANAAVALGATIVEKHFTLDRSLPGPDHMASLEPAELSALVCSIRQIESALGEPEKMIGSAELANRNVARKSLVCIAPVRKGERFDTTNLGVKRPGHGVAPIHFWDWLGRTAERDYAADEVITS